MRSALGFSLTKFRDMDPQVWTKQALITLQEATEAYTVEVVAEHHSYVQKPIPCRFSTCLLLWQGKEVGYSWNSPTCTWRGIWPKWPQEGLRKLQ